MNGSVKKAVGIVGVIHLRVGSECIRKWDSFFKGNDSSEFHLFLVNRFDPYKDVEEGQKTLVLGGKLSPFTILFMV